MLRRLSAITMNFEDKYRGQLPTLRRKVRQPKLGQSFYSETALADKPALPQFEAVLSAFCRRITQKNADKKNHERVETKILGPA